MSEVGIPQASCSHRKRNAVVFICIALAWFALDVITKQYFNGFAEGTIVAGPFAGLFQFRLVHNTGAAWGMFGDSTFMLGILSLVVCSALLIYLFVGAPNSSALEAAGIALVFAGGIGNAFDRFTLGYVVDFIEAVFINFPVFNIADIGVTCGFVVLVLGMYLAYRRSERKGMPLENAGAEENSSL